MSNESKNSRTAVDFVEQTRNRLERSYKNNVIVTIVVLSLITLYFVALNHYVVNPAREIADIYTGEYKGQIEKYTKITKDSLKVANTLTDPDKAPALTLRILVEQTDVTLEGENISWDSWISSLKGNLKKIPQWANEEETYRIGETMKNRVEKWTEKVLESSATGLGETIDAYLEDNKESIAKFAEDTEDEDARNILADGLQARLVNFMANTEITNRGTLAMESKNMLIKLQRANRIVKELAESESHDLNDEQRRLRLAIALIMEGSGELQLPGDGTK
jgi:hypothetical protein